MADRKRVLVADGAPELLTLFALLLDDAGYEARQVLMGPEVLEIAKTCAPEAIMFDLVQGRQENAAILDQLRANPATASIPVVAMSTSTNVLAEAVASHNVRQVMLKPFDAEDVQEKVRAAIEQAPLIALAPPPLAQVKPLYIEVALALSASSRAMVIRWVQRLLSVEPFRGRNLKLVSAIDHIPILLQATIIAVRSADFRAVFQQYPTFDDVVIEHVALRKSQGLRLPDIVTEYQFLREEIRCEIAGILHGKPVSPEETLQIVTRKDFVLDTILRLTAEAYERQAIP